MFLTRRIGGMHRNAAVWQMPDVIYGAAMGHCGEVTAAQHVCKEGG